MNRRSFLKHGVFAVGFMAAAPLLLKSNALAADPSITKIVKTNVEWKKVLTPGQYNVLREEGTEAPFTSPLNNEHREGVFACVACGLELFPSKFKFDSGTGWPSFYDHLPGRIEMKKRSRPALPAHGISLCPMRRPSWPCL